MVDKNYPFLIFLEYLYFIFSYFLDTDEKGKVIKKNPLYDNLIYSQPIEGEIH